MFGFGLNFSYIMALIRDGERFGSDGKCNKTAINSSVLIGNTSYASLLSLNITLTQIFGNSLIPGRESK